MSSFSCAVGNDWQLTVRTHFEEVTGPTSGIVTVLVPELDISEQQAVMLDTDSPMTEIDITVPVSYLSQIFICDNCHWCLCIILDALYISILRLPKYLSGGLMVMEIHTYIQWRSATAAIKNPCSQNIYFTLDSGPSS